MTRQPSPSEANEAMPYGSTRGVKEALDSFLAERDPQVMRNAKRNSPGGRRNRNVIASSPDIVLLNELLGRVKAVRTRVLGRQRQRRRRERLAREQALSRHQSCLRLGSVTLVLLQAAPPREGGQEKARGHGVRNAASLCSLKDMVTQLISIRYHRVVKAVEAERFWNLFPVAKP